LGKKQLQKMGSKERRGKKKTLDNFNTKSVLQKREKKEHNGEIRLGPLTGNQKTREEKEIFDLSIFQGRQTQSS